MTVNKSLRASMSLFALLACGLILISSVRLAQAQATSVNSSATMPTVGMLNVVTLVSGGSATSSLVNVHVLNASSTDVAGSPVAGSAAGTLFILPPGVYTITGLGISGYSGIFSGSCDGSGHVSIVAGGTATCTLTNTASTAGAIATSTSDLSLINLVSAPVTAIGGSITYTLIVTNSGPATAQGVSVSDLLPANLSYISNDGAMTGTNYVVSTGVWTIGRLADGSSTALHITASIQNASTGPFIVDTATATDTNGDPIAQNNTATSTIVIPANTFIPSGTVLSASTSTISSSSCGEYVTGYIKPGATNDAVQVARLQSFLKSYEGANVTVNGIYDAPTIAATEAFQLKFKDDILTPWGISEPTGYVYLTTRQMINEVACKFSETFPLSAAQLSIVATSRAQEQGIYAAAEYPHNRAAGSTTISTSGSNVLQAPTSSSTQSTPIINSFLDNIGTFFKNLFGRHAATSTTGAAPIQTNSK
jgi:uncharacterized repeat protein (TIGR01451 family)